MTLRKLTCLLVALCCLTTLFPAAFGENLSEDENELLSSEEEFSDESSDSTADEEPAMTEDPVTPSPSPSSAAAAAPGTEGVAWTFPISPIDLVMENLIIASHASPLSSSDVPADLVNLVGRRNNEDGLNTNGGIYLATSSAMSLRRPAADMLFRMFEDAESEGIVLYLKQGYRSYQEEEKRKERAASRGETSDTPGESDFQTGMGVVLVGNSWRTKPLNMGYAESPESLWLAENAMRYGFVLRYPSGKEDETDHPYTPWHYRYVGMAVARYMHSHQMTLEAFREEAQKVIDDFTAAGGNLEEAAKAMKLPQGPMILDETDASGDPEISLFHD